MDKTQVLGIMELETLPEPQNKPHGKCIALVERAGGIKDYVIFNNGGISIDKKPVSSIIRVIEYYHNAKKKEPEVVVDEKPKTEYDRDEAIKFLVGMRMDEKKMKGKDDEELKRLLKVYGK